MIRTMKFASSMLLDGKSRVLIFQMFLALASVVAIGSFAPAASAQSGSRPNGERRSEEFVESRYDITLAREKAKAAKKKFETIKKLSRLGSASRKDLRDAELLKWLALLELSNLVSPEKKQNNLLLRARLVSNYRNNELEVIKKLYERGSASLLEFQRAKTARDVAESQLKAVQGVSDAQRKIHVINAASSNYESARKEHQLATKLFRSGSISQVVMDRAKSNLKTAESALADAKKSLGATANLVPQLAN